MTPTSTRGARLRLPVRRIALAATALFALSAPAAHAATVSTTPGESFSSASSTIVARTDGAAEGGKVLGIYATGTAQASVKLTSSITSISVLARGTQCSGAPILQLTVDGVKVASWTVKTTAYTTFSVAKTLATGTHSFVLALSNDYHNASCDRNLFVDTVRGIGATPTSPDLAPPVTAAPVSAKLRWPAPALIAPTTITVAQGDQTYILDNAKDYILSLGTVKHVGGVAIVGGRNVVIKGGAIALPAVSTRSTALLIKDNVGTVHVEGVWFDGSTHEMDAIQVAAPSSTVQVENVRASSLLGSFDGNHSDIIQPWGGVAKLRVDHLSADSNYQGIFTRPDQGAIGSVDLQNVNMAFNNSAATSSGGYLLWMSSDCVAAPTTLSNVYITPRAGVSVGGAVWPSTTDGMCPAKLSGNSVTFPKLPVTGSVTGGTPPTGAFVPAGVAGTSYSSPGYQ